MVTTIRRGVKHWSRAEPFSRDCLLPRPPFEHGPEAREWLRANWSPSAFATNRFSTTEDALKFVERLYAARATDVTIENILMLPNEDWAPYADTLIVRLPENPEWRRELIEVMERVGRPDEDADGRSWTLVSRRFDSGGIERSSAET